MSDTLIYHPSKLMDPENPTGLLLVIAQSSEINGTYISIASNDPKRIVSSLDDTLAGVAKHIAQELGNAKKGHPYTYRGYTGDNEVPVSGEGLDVYCLELVRDSEEFEEMSNEVIAGYFHDYNSQQETDGVLSRLLQFYDSHLKTGRVSKKLSGLSVGAIAAATLAITLLKTYQTRTNKKTKFSRALEFSKPAEIKVFLGI